MKEETKDAPEEFKCVGWANPKHVDDVWWTIQAGRKLAKDDVRVFVRRSDLKQEA